MSIYTRDICRCIVWTSFFVLFTGCNTEMRSVPQTTPTAAIVEEMSDLPAPTPPSTVPELIVVLTGNNDVARIGAARTLGTMGKQSTAAVPALARNLYYKGPYEVRQAAAWALGEIGPAAKQSVPLLTVALLSDFVHVRRAAAEALGKIGDSSAVPALAQLLFLNMEDDKDRSVGVIGADALEKLTGQIFGNSSTSRLTLDENGVPNVINQARNWWEKTGQYQDWLSH
jgi:HEAT repeat protein